MAVSVLHSLARRLGEMGIVAEWQAFGAFAVELLGMPEDAMPFFERGRSWSRIARQIYRIVLDAGNFGHNRDNTFRQKSFLVRSAVSTWRYTCDTFLISMTESGNPRENAIAERVNVILKTEWLNDEHFIGMFDARRRIAEVIDIYNNKRPHTSLNYSTPREAHKMHGEQVRRWKNYYKTNESPEKNKEIILTLTTDVRTLVQASGL